MVQRDLTIAAVGFTSWAAVAWKLSRSDVAPAEAGLALAASLLCLWPIMLCLVWPSAYNQCRESLIPAHLAAQHWIGLRFALPQEAQQLLATPSWARGMLPIFLATFSQPWLYLAFSVCLQRTRLRTFLWTQPLLLAPMLWRGRSHCHSQLAATPEAAHHLQRIASQLQRCSAWLPVGPLRAAGWGSAGALGSDGALAASPGAACLAVHFWLLLVLAYCLPAIVIHRMEGQEQQAAQRKRSREEERRRAARGANGDAGDAARRQQAAEQAGVGGAQHRDLLLQRQQSLLDSAAELLLAGYSAWQLVQLAMPLVNPR